MSRGTAPKEKESSKLPLLPRQYVILSAEQVAAGHKSTWQKLEITGGIHNLAPTVCSLTFLTALYINENNLISLPPCINNLCNLKVLDASNNKLRALPAEIGDLISLEELLLNKNQLRSLPYEIGKLFNLSSIGLSGNPLIPEIQNMYADINGTQKLLTFMLNNLVERTQSPAERKWVTLSESTPNRPSCTFSVMCYNVLCSKYATRQMYGYCPPWALDWEYRKKGIMGEIRKYSADIITLQEVETDAFYNFFLPELKSVGYEGIFSPKSRAKHMHEKEKKFVDGCAIFYNESKFTLVKDHLIEFNQLAMANHDGSEDMLNRVMTKDNIGLAALLHVKQTAWNNMNDKSTEKQHVLVCTAHIHWDPEFCDVKLIQTIMLMTEIRKIVAEFSKSLDDPQSGRTNQHRKGGLPHLSENIHLLLCGDLNSLPDSGVIEFLTSGHVSMNHHDFKGHGYKNSLHKLNVITKSHPPANPNLYTHSFRLRPAFDSSIMPYTNYTYDFKGIIDYIFHTSDTMQTLGALGPIDPAWFKENKVVGCPHPHVPSDHFPLLVHLELWPACFSHIQAPNHQQQQSNQLGHHPNMIGGAGGHHTNNMSGAKNNGNMHR